MRCKFYRVPRRGKNAPNVSRTFSAQALVCVLRRILDPPIPPCDDKGTVRFFTLVFPSQQIGTFRRIRWYLTFM